MEDLMDTIKYIDFSQYGSRTANKIQEEILSNKDFIIPEDALDATKEVIRRAMLKKLFNIIHIEAYNEAMRVGYDDGYRDGYDVGYDEGYGA